ncbi:MAG TPA: class I SAM-dependent methyltransferase [Prolixibacteraceae bacterium]|nr:class I SAM-dependent methyltransferase [Prolixibacteraceae bacterium]
MTDNQNKFYTSISKYYAEIFPYKPMQLQFVKNKVGELNGKQILDIGCATGELAFQLANEGAEVTGIDLNQNLLEQAKSQKRHKNLQFQTGDMLELEKDFDKNQFDVVLCFGNTLVHLPNKTAVIKMLHGVESTLKPGGKLLLQILNYDYILNEKITELPLIETENVKFIRNYNFEEDLVHVKFQTGLHLKKSGEVIFNETTLLALKSGDLLDLLHQSGFKDIHLHANFKGDNFGGKHLPLVASAVM